MPKQKTESKIIRKEIRITPHIQRLINELKEAGEFKSEAEVIKTAIIRMHTEWEISGKLKPKQSDKQRRISDIPKILNDSDADLISNEGNYAVLLLGFGTRDEKEVEELKKEIKEAEKWMQSLIQA
jgi:predicted CopG family antitoxin